MQHVQRLEECSIADQSIGQESLTTSSGSSRQWVRSSYATDVSIIIVNYNTRIILERALKSIIAQQQLSSSEVIVVDNDSRDGSSAMVREQFPEVHCIANERNHGHSGGCNQGISVANGRYLFLLNSDTILMPGAVDRLIHYLDHNPHVGAVGPRVLNMDGTVQGTVKNFPTPWAALFGRFSLLTRWFPNNRFSRQYLVYLNRDFSQPFAVDTVSAAALMVRREAIERAGLFDQKFFLYWNDVDWCRSIWHSGYEIHCVPDAVLNHEEHHGGSRSSASQRLKTMLNFHWGAYLYYRKWHIRNVWHPNHLLAIVGLTSRAVIVVVYDQIANLIKRN